MAQTKAETTRCVHYWIIPMSRLPEVTARCKLCGAERIMQNGQPYFKTPQDAQNAFCRQWAAERQVAKAIGSKWTD